MLYLLLLVLFEVFLIVFCHVVAVAVYEKTTISEAFRIIKETFKKWFLILLVLPACVKIDNHAQVLSGVYLVDEIVTYSNNVVELKQDTLYVKNISNSVLSFNGRINCNNVKLYGQNIIIPTKDSSVRYNSGMFCEERNTIYITIVEVTETDTDKKVSTLVCKKIK